MFQMIYRFSFFFIFFFWREFPGDFPFPGGTRKEKTAEPFRKTKRFRGEEGISAA